MNLTGVIKLNGQIYPFNSNTKTVQFPHGKRKLYFAGKNLAYTREQNSNGRWWPNYVTVD